MLEYKVTSNDWRLQPDPEKSQADVDKMASEGWRLAAATTVHGSLGGRVLLYWEREKR